MTIDQSAFRTILRVHAKDGNRYGEYQTKTTRPIPPVALTRAA